MTAPLLLVTCGHLIRRIDAFRPEIEAAGVALRLPKISGQQLDAAEMTEALKGVDVVIAGDDVIDHSALAAGKADRLRAVIKWGVGVDAIDLAAAEALGVPVHNTPGAFGEEVADLALAHVLALARQAHVMDAGIRDGGWVKVEGVSLSEKTAAIIGLGSIGRAIACRCAAFGMALVGHDPGAPDPLDLGGAPLRRADLDEAIAAADFLILACALTPENRRLLNRERLAALRPGAYVVNVSRGPLVDEAALAEALASGRVAGAGLDVFEVEPLPADSPLRAHPRCFFTAHNGSNTSEAVNRVNRRTVDMALEILRRDPA